MTTGATLHVAVRPREVGAGAVRLKAAGLWPLAAPCGFLIAGAVIGYLFSLDRSVALERLVGLVAATVLSIVVTSGLRRIDTSGA